MIFPTTTQEMFGLDFSIKFTTAEGKQQMTGPGITLGNQSLLDNTPNYYLVGCVIQKRITLGKLCLPILQSGLLENQINQVTRILVSNLEK